MFKYRWLGALAIVGLCLIGIRLSASPATTPAVQKYHDITLSSMVPMPIFGSSKHVSVDRPGSWGMDAYWNPYIPKESLVSKAISYTQKQWPKLIRYLDDGQLNIDNNRAERAVKPFVIGRKAWLFANTKTGAKASATLYSLVETAKINGLEPYHYLTQLFEQLPTANTPEALAKLLPY